MNTLYQRQLRSLRFPVAVQVTIETHIFVIWFACHSVKTPTAAAAFLLGIFCRAKDIVASMEERMQKAATLYFERQDSLLEQLIYCGSRNMRKLCSDSKHSEQKISVGNIIANSLRQKRMRLICWSLGCKFQPDEDIGEGLQRGFAGRTQRCQLMTYMMDPIWCILMRDGEVNVMVSKKSDKVRIARND